jgi:hypothetical protein
MSLPSQDSDFEWLQRLKAERVSWTDGHEGQQRGCSCIGGINFASRPSTFAPHYDVIWALPTLYEVIRVGFCAATWSHSLTPDCVLSLELRQCSVWPSFWRNCRMQCLSAWATVFRCMGIRNVLVDARFHCLKGLLTRGLSDMTRRYAWRSRRETRFTLAGYVTWPIVTLGGAVIREHVLVC